MECSSIFRPFHSIRQRRTQPRTPVETGEILQSWRRFPLNIQSKSVVVMVSRSCARVRIPHESPHTHLPNEATQANAPRTLKIGILRVNPPPLVIFSASSDDHSSWPTCLDKRRAIFPGARGPFKGSTSLFYFLGLGIWSPPV